jgi:diadenosine tetraphosphate (Ap4A) HIT family hydrolase
MIIERTYLFSSMVIPESQVFFASKLTFAIVNIKLVVSQRVVSRLCELRGEEVSELFRCVQLVGGIIEKAYNAHALTVVLQDGVAAGQTVPVSRFQSNR